MHRRPRAHHLRLVASFVVVTLILLAGTATWLTHSHKALANQTTPPAYSHSWYVKDMSNLGSYPTIPCDLSQPSISALYSQGCMDGAWDSSHCTNSLVILDFGQPAEYNGLFGTDIFDSGNSFYNLAVDTNAAEDYAHGWYENTSLCPRLRLALGTNNYSECPVVGGRTHCDLTAWGNSFGSSVAVLDLYLSQHNYRWQITPAAAADMEGEHNNGWDLPAPTEQVVTGFNNFSSAYLYFDYGDATTGQGWGTADFYSVAWGSLDDVPLPETYIPSPNNSCQTYGCIGQWLTVEQNQGAMKMWGPMTECRDGYNFSITESRCTVYPAGQYAPSGSTGAWQDLWNAQSSKFGQVDMPYATNINFQHNP